VLQLLLDKGAALGGRDKNGLTPLDHAATKGHVTVVKLLLEKGAAVNA